jgi:UDP-2,3-diacylglucosamine pyrophosphatase LpxH
MYYKRQLKPFLLLYQESFKLISNHEIVILNTLLTFSKKVKVVFIPGNHDEYVGWNLINLLETYYRNESSIEFDSSIDNTKYHKFGNSAIMLNHGDAIKPVDLAQKFPIGFKHSWSQCDNYYIFTGDKHTELSMDIKGIKFYRVPQLSNAKSKWDDKQGYIDSKAEMTAFVITETNGMSDIYKEII